MMQRATRQTLAPPTTARGHYGPNIHVVGRRRQTEIDDSHIRDARVRAARPVVRSSSALETWRCCGEWTRPSWSGDGRSCHQCQRPRPEAAPFGLPRPGEVEP